MCTVRVVFTVYRSIQVGGSYDFEDGAGLLRELRDGLEAHEPGLYHATRSLLHQRGRSIKQMQQALLQAIPTNKVTAFDPLAAIQVKEAVVRDLANRFDVVRTAKVTAAGKIGGPKRLSGWLGSGSRSDEVAGGGGAAGGGGGAAGGLVPPPLPAAHESNKDLWRAAASQAASKATGRSSLKRLVRQESSGGSGSDRRMRNVMRLVSMSAGGPTSEPPIGAEIGAEIGAQQARADAPAASEGPGVSTRPSARLHPAAALTIDALTIDAPTLEAAAASPGLSSQTNSSTTRTIERIRRERAGADANGQADAVSAAVGTRTANDEIV